MSASGALCKHCGGRRYNDDGTHTHPLRRHPILTEWSRPCDLVVVAVRPDGANVMRRRDLVKKAASA